MLNLEEKHQLAEFLGLCLILWFMGNLLLIYGKIIAEEWRRRRGS